LQKSVRGQPRRAGGRRRVVMRAGGARQRCAHTQQYKRVPRVAARRCRCRTSRFACATALSRVSPTRQRKVPPPPRRPRCRTTPPAAATTKRYASYVTCQPAKTPARHRRWQNRDAQQRAQALRRTSAAACAVCLWRARATGARSRPSRRSAEEQEASSSAPYRHASADAAFLSQSHSRETQISG